MRVADFFCGSGGFSEGFRQAGFEICFAVDKWAPAVDTYRANKPGAKAILDDVIRISELPEKDFHDLVPDTEVIIGSPPCVAFSNSNKSGYGDKTHGIRLIEAYLKIIARKKFKKNSILKYWILENVPNAEAHIKEKYTADDLGLDGEIELLPKGGASGVYNAKHFGAPTNRKRYLCGEFPKPMRTHTDETAVTLETVLESLKRPMDNEPIVDCNNTNFEMKFHDITDHNYECILADFEWKTAERLKRDRGYMGKMSFPEDVKKPSRTVMATMSCSSRESMILGTGIQNKYRLPTVREVASMMSFPIDYRFYGKTKGVKYTLVGNAVPPLLSYALAKAIVDEKGPELPKKYVPIEHDPSVEFHDLNYRDFPSKEEKRKRDVAKFKYHIPYLIRSAYRVELTNYNSCFEDKKFIWDVAVHYSQGKKNAKVYETLTPKMPLCSDIKVKIETYVKSNKRSLVSFDAFQKIYCMTESERATKKGPFEILESVRTFIHENESMCDNGRSISVSVQDGIEKEIPDAIVIGYMILADMIRIMQKK